MQNARKPSISRERERERERDANSPLPIPHSALARPIAKRPISLILYNKVFISHNFLLRCKGTTKFAHLQILSGKSFRSSKSFKGYDAIMSKDYMMSTFSGTESTFLGSKTTLFGGYLKKTALFVGTHLTSYNWRSCLPCTAQQA